jgi:hypothetical protein
MIHGCVTLDEVFAAAGARAASLVPETSGYLALAVGDATSRLPFAIDDTKVMLTTEGNVGITKRGEILPPKDAAKGLRAILARLLGVSTGTAMPSLTAAARAREESDRGVDAVVEEIEAALIPVNRAAARRALARLARETIKAKEQGKLRRASARPPAQPAEALPAKKMIAAEVVEAVPAKKMIGAEPVETLPAIKMIAPEPVETLPAIKMIAPEPVEARREPKKLTPPPTEARVSDHTAQPSVVIEATTPPPMDVPVDEVAEPTPTVLGMAAVEIEDDVPPRQSSFEMHAQLDALAEEQPVTFALDRTPETSAPLMVHPIATPAPAPVIEPSIEISVPIETPAPIEISRPLVELSAPLSDLVVPQTAAPAAVAAEEVLAQPSESPSVAFEVVRRAERQLDPITPPFDLEVAPAPPPIAAAAPIAVAKPAVPITHALTPRAPRAACTPVPPVPTRADDLLARFGASCSDDAQMIEAAACLRRLAGIELTPPPPARVDVRVTPATPPPPETTTSLPDDWQTPIAPRSRARGGVASSLGLGFAVLLVGLAGGGALVHYRPEIFGAILRAPAQPAAVQPAPVKNEAAPPAAPAATVEPTGAMLPAHEHLGSPRAARGTEQRAR